MATAGTAQEHRELVADESAATVGENRRTAGETCQVLLADAGGRTSEPAAVRDHAGSYCPVASAVGINAGVEITESLAVKSVSAPISAAWNVVKPGYVEGNLENGCRFVELRGELRWQLLFNGAQEGTSVYNLCSFRSQKGNSGLMVKLASSRTVPTITAST